MTRFPAGASIRLEDLAVDPYPAFARLREAEPVSWIPETRMWFVTRRADVIAMLRDPQTFTTDAEDSTIADVFGRHMMTTEGDEALRYKRRCLPTFRTASIDDSHGAWLGDRTQQLLEPLRARSEGDLMASVATPLAVESVLRSLGLDLDLGPRISAWYDDFAAALANFRRDVSVRARGKASAAAFAEMIIPILDELRLEPAPGLLSAMVSPETDPFTDDEAVANALIILFGGIETTESMIADSAFAVLQHPASWSALQRDASLRPGAIEEALRWTTPVQSCTRHTTRPVEIRGVTIPRGEVVQGMLGSANRDPAHFDEPDRFDISRPNAVDHLGFGTGRHLCLGAPLARLETRTVLDALLDDVRPVRLDPDRPAHLHGYEFRKPADLWIVWS